MRAANPPLRASYLEKETRMKSPYEPMKPQSSDLDFLESISNNTVWAAGQKWDGYRELLWLRPEGNLLFSSSGREHIENTPQFSRFPSFNFPDTVLDCEGLSPTGRLEDNASCFKASSYNSFLWQKDNGLAYLVAFDCLRFRGKDLTNLPLIERVSYLLAVTDSIGSPLLKQEKLFFTSKLEEYDRIISNPPSKGREGLILKHIQGPYITGTRTRHWLKVKRVDTFTYLITGFQTGQGKYSDMVGAVYYGRSPNEFLGTSSGMTDKVRADMTYYPEKYLNKEAIFRAQELTDKGVMRHPRFLRMKEEERNVL